MLRTGSRKRCALRSSGAHIMFTTVTLSNQISPHSHWTWSLLNFFQKAELPRGFSFHCLQCCLSFLGHERENRLERFWCVETVPVEKVRKHLAAHSGGKHDAAFLPQFPQLWCLGDGINILEGERASESCCCCCSCSSDIPHIHCLRQQSLPGPLSPECVSYYSAAAVQTPPAVGNTVSLTSQAGPSVWQLLLFLFTIISQCCGSVTGIQII